MAAQTALFDGAARLKAPAMGDDAVSGKDGSGAPALRPSDKELTAAWKEAKPKSKAIDAFGKDFVAAAAEAVQKYTFMGEYFLQQFNPKGSGMMDFRGRAIASSAADLVAAHDDRENPAARKFMRLLGRWMAYNDHAEEKAREPQMALMKRLGRGPSPHLTPSPITNGEYWDMAAGMNAQGFIHRELDPNVNYSFFDYSPFVVSYLETAAELAGKKNAKIVEGDIGALQKPVKPIAVLRTKNAVHYVPGFAKKLEEMVDWVAPNGQLVIQNDPNPGQRTLIINGHGALIRRLLAEGWTAEYGFSGYEGKFGKYALDTLVLTKPAAPTAVAADKVASAWRAYTNEVDRINNDFNPFAMFFR
jgi:SAM-dependent methyltransferase